MHILIIIPSSFKIRNNSLPRRWKQELCTKERVLREQDAARWARMVEEERNARLAECALGEAVLREVHKTRGFLSEVVVIFQSCCWTVWLMPFGCNVRQFWCQFPMCVLNERVFLFFLVISAFFGWEFFFFFSCTATISFGYVSILGGYTRFFFNLAGMKCVGFWTSEV